MTEQPQPILLVEDDPGHVLLIEKNLRRAGVTNEIIKLDEGGKAVEFLFREGEFAALSTPMPLLHPSRSEPACPERPPGTATDQGR